MTAPVSHRLHGPACSVLLAAAILARASALRPISLSLSPRLSLQHPIPACSWASGARARPAMTPRRCTLMPHRRVAMASTEDGQSPQGLSAKEPAESEGAGAAVSTSGTDEQSGQAQQPRNVSAPLVPLVLYALLGAACLFFTLMATSVQLALIVDYYAAVLCLCGIIFSAERKVFAALWSVACLHLGSPICLVYVLQRIFRNKPLRLAAFSPEPADASSSSASISSDGTSPAQASGQPSTTAKTSFKTPYKALQGLLYSVALLFCFYFLAFHPPPMEVALTVDYYGTVLSLCAFIIASERKRIAALWCTACLFFGSSFVCAYVLVRLVRHKTLGVWKAA